MHLLRLRYTIMGAACAATLALATGSAIGQARDMASPLPMDCTQTRAMIDEAMKATPPAMTGGVDQDTLEVMRMHVTMAMQMAKIEVSCGQDAKKKAAAQKLLDESRVISEQIERIKAFNY